MKLMKSMLLSGLTLVFSNVASADTWQVDSSHTQANFKVRHMMISWVHGKITEATGTVEYDGKDFTKAKVDITLDPKTIDTGNAKRDEHLRSPDFFDVAKFPTMSFKSTKITKVGSGMNIAGDLSLHGVTKSVVLKCEAPSKELKDAKGGSRVGVSGTTKINRKDFGLSWNKALEAGGVAVGEELDINVEIEIMKPGTK